MSNGISSHSFSKFLLDAQSHAPAALPLYREPPEPLSTRLGGSPRLWRRDKLILPGGNRPTIA